MKHNLLSLLFASFLVIPSQSSYAADISVNASTTSTNSNCDSAVASTGFSGGRQCSVNGGWSSAIDVVIAADSNLTISKFTPSVGMDAGVTATSVRVRFYNNANGNPGALISTQNIVPTSQTLKGSGLGVNFSDLLLDLTPVTLTGSAGSTINYWIAIQVTTSNGSTAYMETANSGIIGGGIAFSDGGNFIIPDSSKEGVYSVTAECSPIDADIFPSPYCGPLVYGTIEPITLVQVAGISNTSSNVLGGSSSHQNFTDIVGEMSVGETYTITLKGNTNGNYSNYFTVYIDWNQNNVLNNIGEVYTIEMPLINSTGIDDVQITAQIDVPANALLGPTRMRVAKIFGDPNILPCASGSNWGQAEDYTINVSEALSVNNIERFAGFSYFPNPSANVLNLSANNTIESIAIFNLLGQEVHSTTINETSSSINVSNLATGNYIMKVTIDGVIGTYKFVKK